MEAHMTPYNENELSHDLHDAIRNSRDERIQALYGRKDHDPTSTVNRADQLADVIMDGVRDLSDVDRVERACKECQRVRDQAVRKGLEVLPSQVVRAVQERLAGETVAMLATAERRYDRLLVMGLTAACDLTTARFLRKVGKCYLYGLDEPCLIMCRSALEAQFLKAVPDEVCRKHCENEGPYSLHDRIVVAHKADIIDSETKRWAAKVKNVANDLLHPKRKLGRRIDEQVVQECLMMTVLSIQLLAKGHVQP